MNEAKVNIHHIINITESRRILTKMSYDVKMLAS